MTYKPHFLSLAKNQTFGYLVGLSDEKTGAMWHTAITKAIDELEENKSILFDRRNEVLSFTSRFSKKRRIVTASGCHFSCDCRGLPSYHFALFELLRRYYELAAADSDRPYFQKRLSNQERITCGGIKF